MRRTNESANKGQVATNEGSERGGPFASTTTFLFTDIENFTETWERTGVVFEQALTDHHALLREAFGRHGAGWTKALGDGFLVAFASAADALACAIAAQQALGAWAWPPQVGALRVRMALDTGDAVLEDGDYHSVVVNRASRLCGAAWGGQVLCSEVTAGLLGRGLPRGVVLRDRGVYRLRGLLAPQRLFEVEHPSLPRRDFPPPNAEPVREANLPLPLTRFFGRVPEMAQLEALVLAPQTRLVTLTGPGGSGKTRLALEGARQLAPLLQGAVWFVPLAELSDPLRIADAIRDALQLSRQADAHPVDQVAPTLSQQPSLLVLDNFEQLADEGAFVVQELLTRVPTLTCLVTSRRSLNLSGEHEFPVAPLPTPSQTDTFAQIAGRPSVQVFVDRAQSVRPSFQVNDQNASAVAQLCQGLEGIPLALELAASRMRVLTPAQMLLQLKHRLDWKSPYGDVADRHRTLHAAIDWSYDLLAPDLQLFWARLSVFRGGWFGEAAGAVCGEGAAAGADDVIENLEHLRQASLILAEEVVVGGQPEIRFRMLETLREYASGQLSSGEQTVLQQRHYDRFLALAEQAEPQLYGPDQAMWLDRLELEHDNLRAALAGPNGDEKRLRLASTLWWFWYVRGHPREGRRWLEEALSYTNNAPEALRAKALNAAGNLALPQGDHTAARRFHEEGLSLRRKLGDRPGVASSLNNLGIVARFMGDHAAARSLNEESLELYRELGETGNVAKVLTNLATMIIDQGDYVAARPILEEVLSMQRELGHKGGVALALHNLGEVMRKQGEWKAARPFFQESLVLSHELSDTQGAVNSLNGLGLVAVSQGDHVEAAQILGAEAAVRAAANLPLAPIYRLDYDYSVTHLRIGLGENVFEATWAQGKAMTLEQVIEYALQKKFG